MILQNETFYFRDKFLENWNQQPQKQFTENWKIRRQKEIKKADFGISVWLWRLNRKQQIYWIGTCFGKRWKYRRLKIKLALRKFSFSFLDKFLDNWDQRPKNSLRKTERFGERKKLKKRIMEFQFWLWRLDFNQQIYWIGICSKNHWKCWDKKYTGKFSF